VGTKKKIAKELSTVMPKIVRMIVLKFTKNYQHLPPAQIFALLLMADVRQLKFSQFVKQLNVSAPTASVIVSRLVKQGMIKRLADMSDKRAVTVALTARGMKAAREIKKSIQKQWCLILEVLTVRECQEYLAIVRKIADRI